MTHPLQPPTESGSLSELTTRIREGRYQVPGDQVADRILTKLTAPQTQIPAPDSGSRWSEPDRRTDPGLTVGHYPHSQPRSPVVTSGGLSPTEVGRYHDWVQHHRHLEDNELSEVARAVLTPQEARRYHDWVQHHRRLEDTEIEVLLNGPDGSGRLEER